MRIIADCEREAGRRVGGAVSASEVLDVVV